MIEAAKLGEGLVRAGLLTEDQLRAAFDAQATSGADMRDVLVQLGLLSETTIAAHIAREQLMHFVDPDISEIDEELMSKIPRELIEKHTILALKGEHGVLLAISEADDFRAIEEIQFITNSPVESALAPRSAIRRGIDRCYQHIAARKKAGPEERARSSVPEPLRRLLAIPGDTLLRALVLTMVERGEIEAERLLGHAAEVEAAKKAQLAAASGATAASRS